ncbi:unnamed protein product [Protopolystoma xenopodis]|uniref:Uncharacterized protein n=1 Tax=Protopolystoma xenopodis TaxID=117903 RepID=A0A3S5FF99_9PLAT|nr:unnamed protein product [Protopolystoma xenopodis]
MDTGKPCGAVQASHLENINQSPIEVSDIDSDIDGDSEYQAIILLPPPNDGRMSREGSRNSNIRSGHRPHALDRRSSSRNESASIKRNGKSPIDLTPELSKVSTQDPKPSSFDGKMEAKDKLRTNINRWPTATGRIDFAPEVRPFLFLVQKAIYYG